MNFGIIGVGAIGGTIAKKLAKAGHSVKVANSRGKDAVMEFAGEIGAEASDLTEISQDVDVLIVSIPYGAISSLPKDIFENLDDDAIVIDAGNYYPEVRNENIEDLGNGEVESIWFSDKINRPVVKAFNTLLAYSLAELGKPSGDENRLAMQISGDDENQKKIVTGLIDECGFDSYDCGTLSESWTMQPSSAGYCCDYTLDELTEVKKKSVQTPESVAENRAYFYNNFAELASNDFSHENVIRLNRKYNV